MNTYKKRIAFVIAAQHLHAHGGIGQFALGFLRIARNRNWKVDIILDKPFERSAFIDRLKEDGASFIWPDNVLTYREHTSTFAFSDSLNFEKMANFRTAMMTAFETNLYDAIICNSYESMPAIYALDIAKLIPVIFYTHNESMIFRNSRKGKNVFAAAFNDFFNKMIEVPDVIVGTQTDRNAVELCRYIEGPTVSILPLPMPEERLLIGVTGQKHGVLFIGRWEPGKDPETFLEVIKESGLPANILTNANGARKFEKWFQENNITDFKIGIDLTGQEKVDFIRTSRVHFNTSHRESYGLGFFEAIGHMPCLVTAEADWPMNFDRTLYKSIPKNQCAEILKKMYDKGMDMVEATERIDYVSLVDHTAEKCWALTIERAPIEIKNSSARINSFTGRYQDFILSLNRMGGIAVDDLKPVLANRGKFHIVYTDTDTYLTHDPNFVPSGNIESLENLFE